MSALHGISTNRPSPGAESRGVSVWLLRWLVLKELVDNALDACGANDI
jgi:hypothetical protein